MINTDIVTSLIAAAVLLFFLDRTSNLFYKYKIEGRYIKIDSFPIPNLISIDIDRISDAKIIGPTIAFPIWPPFLKFGARVWAKWIYICMDGSRTPKYGICPPEPELFLVQIRSKMNNNAESGCR
jgi:hypothetical protein